MNVSTSEIFEPHSGNERVVDLDRLDDLPLQKPDSGKDVLGSFDILHGQLDPEERERIFSSARRPTEIMDMEVASNPDSESEDHVLEKINQARADKDFSTVYELVKKIDDDALLLTVVRGVVADLVDVLDYDTAKKFLFLIKDPDIYARELSYLLENQNDANNPLADFEPTQGVLKEEETDSAVNRIRINRLDEKPSGDFEAKKIDIVSDEDFENFVKTGEVSGDILVLIADRISRGEKTTEREMAIYDTFKDKIELLLKNRLGEDVNHDIDADTDSLDLETGDFVRDEKVDNNPEKDIPTAVEVAMKKADEVVSKSDTATAPEVVPPIPVSESVDIAEKLEKDLSDSRRELIEQETIWRAKNQQSKSWVRRNLLGNLGLDKQTPLVPEPSELEEARIVYNLAKKNKLREVLNRGDITSLTQEVEKERSAFEQKKLGYSPKVVKESQVNRDIRSGILGLNPKEEGGTVYEVEKGAFAEKFEATVRSAIEKWSKLPKPVQIATSTALITGTSFTFGLAAAAGPLGYAGYRVAKSALVGGVVSQPFGKVVDKIFERKNKASDKESMEEFSEGIDLDNFMEKEAERMSRDEKMVDAKKRQRFAKAAAKVAVGGITSAGLEMSGASEAIFGPKDINLPGKGTLNVPNDYGNIDKYLDKLDNAKSAVNETLTSDNQLDNLEQFKPVVESSIQNVVETEVLPVPETVIKGLHNLKAEIMSEYGGEVPEGLKPIMDKTPKELATIFDLNNPANIDFDPSLASENISVGSDGNVYYEHQDGSKQTLFDSKAGKFYRFDGTVASEISTTPLTTSGSEVYPNGKIGDDVYSKLDFGGNKVLAPDPIIKTAGTEVLEGDPIFKTEAVSVLDVKDTTDEAIERVSIPEESEVAIADEKLVTVPGEVEDRISVGGDKNVEVLTVGENKFVSYEGMRIGQEITQNGKKLFVLDDNFQDGEQYAPVRNAFTKAFEKNATVSVLGPNPIAESFEGGKIYISYNVPNDPDSVKILLNGKEIASGSTSVVDGKGIPKIKLYGNLKGGWFLVDNAYERAFKHIDKMIKSGTFDFAK